jgi:AcrR family transcriptional regulator
MAYQPTEKTLRKKAETRQRILEAAHQIVAQQGFQGISILSVADKAGIASGSLYRYFASKTELCSQVFILATRVEVEQVRLSLAAHSHPWHQFSQAIEHFARRALKGKTLAWALIAEPVDPVVEQDRLQYRRAYAELFENAINQGIQSGILPPQNAKVCAAALVGVMAETLVGPLAPDGHQISDTEREQLIKSVKTFCLQAIACPMKKREEHE